MVLNFYEADAKRNENKRKGISAKNTLQTLSQNQTLSTSIYLTVGISSFIEYYSPLLHRSEHNSRNLTSMAFS